MVHHNPPQPYMTEHAIYHQEASSYPQTCTSTTTATLTTANSMHQSNQSCRTRTCRAPAGHLCLKTNLPWVAFEDPDPGRRASDSAAAAAGSGDGGTASASGRATGGAVGASGTTLVPPVGVIMPGKEEGRSGRCMPLVVCAMCCWCNVEVLGRAVASLLCVLSLVPWQRAEGREGVYRSGGGLARGQGGGGGGCARCYARGKTILVVCAIVLFCFASFSPVNQLFASKRVLCLVVAFL